MVPHKKKLGRVSLIQIVREGKHESIKTARNKRATVFELILGSSFLVVLTLLKMRGLAGWTCMLRAAQVYSIYISNNFT